MQTSAQYKECQKKGKDPRKYNKYIFYLMWGEKIARAEVDILIHKKIKYHIKNYFYISKRIKNI